MSFNHLKFHLKVSKNPQQSVVLLITSPIQCSPLDDIEPVFIRANVRRFTTSCFKFVSVFSRFVPFGPCKGNRGIFL